MKGRTIGRRVLAAGLLGVLGAVLAVTAGQASASPLRFAYDASAYGSMVKVGTAVTSGPTFPAILWPCTAKAGDRNLNSGAALNLPNVLNAGTIANSTSSSASSTAGSVQATSNIQTVSLLSGLVTATTVHTMSRVTYSGGTFHFSNGSRVTTLNVDGHPVTVSANRSIAIAGLGYVVIDEQNRNVKGDFASQSVTMIHLHVTVSGNVYGLSPGTDIYIGRAIAAIKGPIPGGPVGGFAYGTHANVGSTVISGFSSILHMPCLGGSHTTSLASANLPKIGTTGTIATSTYASAGAAKSTGHSTSAVQTVRLLGGLVRATVVKADVYGSFDGATHHFYDHSTATSLVVNGARVTATPGTVVNLAGLGTLYVHRVAKTGRSYEVRMLELVVTVPNQFNIAVGTDVRIGVARVQFPR